MTPINSKEEAEKLFDKLLSQRIPEIIRKTTGNFRSGIIKVVGATTVTVEISGTNDMKNLPIPRGITGITVNDKCLIIVLDPQLGSKMYLVAVYK